MFCKRLNGKSWIFHSSVLVGSLWCLFLPAAAGAELQKVKAGLVVEVTLTSEKVYDDPFNEVHLDAVFTGPDGTQLRVPGFWGGADRWCFRYSSNKTGRHGWRTECSDTANTKLHGVAGKVEVVPYAGDNPLYRHGPLKVAEDRHHFEHRDGTPFFWLGDTWWKGLCKRIPWEGFQKLTADRKAKGFTVVQIVAGTYPDEQPFDPRWENEGGMPYEKDYARINPAYFDYADRRIHHLVESGIVPAIVGGWYWHLPSIGEAKMKKHWRYLIARYGAYPTVWIIGGESAGKTWTEIARYARSIDPYHRLVTMHPHSSGRRAVTDETVLDFDMLQTGHSHIWKGRAYAVPNAVAKVTSHFSKTPAMPVVVGEAVYEGHMLVNHQDVQRLMFWTCMMNGAAGHTYGAGGIWQMNSETERGSAYEFTPWHVAMHYPGSYQLGLGKRLLEQYQWWRFEPHPEWVEPHSTVLLEPHQEWYDENKKWEASGGRYDLPYAAGIPNEVRFIYIPGHTYDWSAPVVKHLEPGVTYHAYYFNPASGRKHDLGKVGADDFVTPPSSTKKVFEDNFNSGRKSAWVDQGTPTHVKNGRLFGGKGMWTVLKDVKASDLIASVEAQSDAEAGIMLRYYDTDNYLVGLYTPSLKSIYLHERKNGNWGPGFGSVPVPEIGPNIRLTAEAYGSYASLVVTDGNRKYSTPAVKVVNKTPGSVGVWHFQIGDTQAFDNFELHRAVAADSGENRKCLSEDMRPLLTADFSWSPTMDDAIYYVGSGRVRHQGLPAPQDWVLVLERIE